MTSKLRLIHHLSYPTGDSINDGISPEDAHVQYQSIDRTVQQLQQLGQGRFCVWSKTDIADAFRIVPLHPSQLILPVWLCLARAVLLRSLPAHGLQCKLQDV